MIRRRLLRGSAWVFGGKVITMLVGLVIHGMLARLLTVRELGAYFTTFTLVMAGSLLAQLGLDRTVVRLIASAVGTGQPGQATSVVRMVFLLGSFGSVTVGCVLVLGLGGWLSRHLFRSELIEAVIPLAAGWLIFTAIRSLAAETFRGFQRFGLATLFDVLLVDVLFAGALTLLFTMQGSADLRTVVLVAFFVAAFATLVAAGFVLRQMRAVPPDGHADVRAILYVTMPLLVTNVAIYLLGSGIDLWVLGAFRPQEQVALYGAAARLMMYVATPYLILSGVAPPLIAELHSQGRKRELERALRAIASLSALPAFLILMVYCLFGSTIMGHLYGPFYRQGATVLAVLSVARFIAVWTGPSGATLMMTGHQNAMLWITLFSAALSVTSAVVAAPHFGRVGVAVATATSQGIQHLLQLVFARRLVGVWTHVHLSLRPLVGFVRRRASSAHAEKP